MKRFIISLLTVVALGAILFTGCVGAPPPAAEAPPEAEISAHFTTYTDEVGLFSISYPPDWELALSEIEGLEQATEELLESIEQDIPLERVSTIFFAGLPTEMGYTPNVNIVCESFPGLIVTHEIMVEAEIQGLKDFVQGYHEFSRVKTTVGGREATIVDWEGTIPGLPKQHSLQLFTLVGKVAWIVTCTPPAGEFSEHEDDFHAIVRSLRILK